MTLIDNLNSRVCGGVQRQAIVSDAEAEEAKTAQYRQLIEEAITRGTEK
jgi:uncharacterized protein with ATP-grasp and redox domains